MGQLGEDGGALFLPAGPLSMAFHDDHITVTITSTPADAAPARAVYEVRFPGSNQVSPQGMDATGTSFGFFLGNDPSRWVSGVEGFASVLYRDLWDCVDLRYLARDGALKYEFIVRPGGDPASIGLSFSGVEGVAIDGAGDLVVRTPAGYVRDERPTTYQDGPGGRAPVSSSFRVGADGEVGFRVGPYDTTASLVIDPRLLFCTFLGSASADWAQGCAIGGDGDIYVMAVTEGLSFPTTTGAFDPTYSGGTDILLCRLSQNGGRLLNATYIGGSGNDNGYYTVPSQVQNFGGIQVDGTGTLYLTGHTNSTDFPTTTSAYDRSPNGGYDAFVLRMSPALDALEYSTYVGGAGDDFATDLALDTDGNPYVVGTTLGAIPVTAGAFDPTPNGAEDAFALELDATLSSLLRSTLIGGSQKDWGNAIAVDDAGCAYIVGTTESGDFPIKGAYDPTHNGLRDMFVTKIAANWSALRYSTFIGTSGQDYAYDLVIDDLDRAYAVGYTTSSAFPTVSGCLDGQSNGGIDTVVLRMDSSGSSLGRCTYFGGSGDERGFGISLTSGGDVLVTGATTGTVPVTSDAYATVNAGDNDVFVARLDGTLATLKYGSLFGGSGDDISYAIESIRTGDGLVVGQTVSRNFPASPGALQQNISGGTDGFILMVGEPRPPSWGTIPHLAAVEDVPLVHNFTDIARDPDTPPFLLTISVFSPYVSKVSGLEVTFLFPNGVLAPDILMELCDEYAKVKGRVNFTVTPVNDPPTCDIPARFYALEDEPLKINFTNYVHDIDSPFADLRLSTDSPEATVSGLVVTVLYHEGGVSGELWVNVSDGLAMTEVHIEITVGPVDDPPVILALPTFEAAEDSISVFNLTPYLSDVDTPLAQLTITVSDPDITVDGQELRYFPHRGDLHFTVRITVSDATTQVAVDLSVHVTEVNDPPIVYPVPLQTVIEDEPGAIDLSTYIDDEDTPRDSLVLESSDPCVRSINGLGLTLLFTAWEPDRQVNFTVFDGIARTGGSIHVQIRAVDDAPVIVTVGGRSPPFTLDIDEGATAYYAVEVWDEDSLRFEYSIQSAWPAISVLQNGTIHILADKGDPGEYSAVLTVDDLGGQNASATIHIKVRNVNEPPSEILLLEPFNHSIVEEGDNVTFSIDVSDPDTLLGQVLTAVWTSNISGPLKTRTSLDGLQFTTNVLPIGTHRITINITDGQYTKTRWFELTVAKKYTPVIPHVTPAPSSPWFLAIMVIAIAVTLAALVAVVVVLKARRRMVEEEEEEEREVAKDVVSVPAATGATEVMVPQGPLTMEGDLAKLGRQIGDMAAQLEAQRAAESVATSQARVAVPEFEEVPVPVELTAKEEADRERTREVREVMRALTQLPQGLPTTLWGWDMAELARAIVDGERRKEPDGTSLVKIKDRWYNDDRTNVGVFVREWKEPEPAARTVTTAEKRDLKLEQLETALLEGKISEQTYKELKAKYEK